MLAKKQRVLLARRLKAILGVPHPVACVAAKAIVRHTYPAQVCRALGANTSPTAQAAYAALLPHLRRQITPDGDSVSFWDFSLGL
ncbi:hypothetical protein [Deinococcus sp. S9]|uniref:hypothetical protein n=1 Tax=Deinococcus sp. S9 TaxID=2545754 RepID=UPI001055DB4F|nr:hypothetical protein [Deinococcus sp. S9]TDE84690.1 hypothetical protein E0686_15830 [Deinococcus sp. S9]